uniref:Uncharacterized protein n=1 Tax=Arundo donax TaxID=35708 RepID=A0A0A9HM15_ARUDO
MQHTQYLTDYHLLVNSGMYHAAMQY